MTVRSVITIGILLCLPFIAGAQTSIGTGTAALESLNRYRQSMGLGTLAWNNSLAETALGHSQYLAALKDRNVLSQLAPDGTPEMHMQRSGNAHFTGATVGERAKRRGYAFGTGEQVVFSDQSNSGPVVIDQLMATVYHRSGLLSPTWSEFGGAVDGKDAVIVMGEGGVKSRVVNDWLSTYPAPQSTTARIGFQNEIPNPAPDRPGQWLGLPISIHAVPGRTLKAHRFEVREFGTYTRLSARLLQRDNDSRIAASEIFLMPEQPLRYAARYEVLADISIQKATGGIETRRMQWTFHTPSNPFSVSPVASRTEVQPGQTHMLEIKGTQSSWSWNVQTTMPQGVHLDTQDMGGGKMKINFPTNCNADCSAVVTIEHEGPQPSTERREFVTAKAWLATRSEDELIPASFVQAAKQLQNQSAPHAMAYGKVGHRWFMSTAQGAANQSSAEQSALEGCAKQAEALGGSRQNCQQYLFK